MLAATLRARMNFLVWRVRNAGDLIPVSDYGDGASVLITYRFGLI
jgi:hypothetical protein